MGIIGPSCFKVQQQFAKKLALWNTGPVFSKIYARKLVRFGRLRRVLDISIHSLLYLAPHPVIQSSPIVKVLTLNPDFSGFWGSLRAGYWVSCSAGWGTSEIVIDTSLTERWSAWVIVNVRSWNWKFSPTFGILCKYFNRNPASVS